MYTKYSKHATFLFFKFVEKKKIIYDSFFLKQNTYEFSELYRQLDEAIALAQ